MPLVRICAGGGQQWPSLPRLTSSLALCRREAVGEAGGCQGQPDLRKLFFKTARVGLMNSVLLDLDQQGRMDSTFDRT